MKKRSFTSSLARRLTGCLAVIAVAAVCLAARPASAQGVLNELPEAARGVGMDDRLGNRVPFPIIVRSELGEAVDLASYFNKGKPVLLSLVYYDCPLQCPALLENLSQTIGECPYEPGVDYTVLVVSFDPTNTEKMAQEAKRDALVRHELTYGRRVNEDTRRGIMFHVAGEAEARRLADAVGFRYKLLVNGEYSHPSALIVLSPEGVVTRYLPGFNTTDQKVGPMLRMALLEASNGRIARGFIDWFVHTCFTFDPDAGAYNMEAMAVMRLAGGGTVVLLGGLIGVLFLKERLRRRPASAGPVRLANAANRPTPGFTGPSA